LHALLNTASLIFFTSSLVARRAKNRSLGRSLALAGYGMVAASGFLGGDLVFRQKIGVSHAQPAATVPDWTPVLAEGQLREGVMTRAEVQGVKMLFLRRGNQVFAINEVCAHLGGPLSEGKLDGNTVICPWHGSRYDLATGTVLDGPSAYSQACYQTRVRSGVVEIRQAQAEGVQQPSAEITMS
jgi:nitrite reductase/ring-hydroxylating ferredoxin subunit